MSTLKRPLTFLVCVNLAVVALRILYTGEIFYAFLVWNLLLAFIPFWVSSWAVKREWPKKKKLWLAALGLLWLFFLPNAPYILTDFYHLRTKSDMTTIWFDMWMLFSYSLTGLIVFYASLLQALALWKKYVKSGGEVFIAVTLVLCSLAIYLGRYIRFNSWDLFIQPGEVLSSFVTALSSGSFWRIVIPYFLFLIAGYVFARLLRSCIVKA